MGVTSSAPALVGPVKLHSSRMIMCSDLPEGYCEWYQEWWHNWYNADWAFALPIVYFFCAAIGAFTVLNGIHKVRQTPIGVQLARIAPYYAASAAWGRAVFGRQVRYTCLTTGVFSLITLFIAFVAALTLGPQPYYWPVMKDMPFAFGGSPPIATRSGWIALGCLPFVIFLSSKWNVISILTGVSHEKLQIFHQWSAWVMFVAGLVHTFGFVVYTIREHGIVEAWHTSGSWWTGVLCLVPNALMMLLSLSPIRNRFYETFKIVHFVLAIIFIVTLFIHCGFTLSSADYFIALGTIYLLSLFIRWSRSIVLNGFKHHAVIHSIDSTCLTVEIPTQLKWTPGQHYFVRFLLPGVAKFTSHPFTASSIPSKENSKIELLIKAQSGVTRQLVGIEEVGVLLDGPYGGIEGKPEFYDHVLLLAGGSGASFVLGILRHLAAQPREVFQVKSITVVYASRSAAMIHYFTECCTTLSTDSFKFALHSHCTTLSDAEKSEESLEDVTFCRPTLVQHITEATERSGSVAIAACGPEGFNRDVRAAVADAQWRILRGVTATTECWLHTEAYSW